MTAYDDTASLVLAVLAAISGITSAFYWWKASLAEVAPQGGHLSGEPLVQQASWIAALLAQSMRSAHLNAVAARWSAATAIFGVLSAVFGNGLIASFVIAHLL